MQNGQLLTSIHDVCPFHMSRIDRLVPMIEQASGGGNYALFVVPDFHDSGRIDRDAAFARRLRAWSAAGCDIFLHGYRHLDDAAHRGLSSRFKARHLTAGEGEFLSLDYDSAVARLRAGRQMIEDITGRPVAGFVAPAWLYGEPSLRAIADEGFALVENHFRLWEPPTGAVLARGPVLTYASRSRMRLLSSIAWSRIATLALALQDTVRIGVHPGDVSSPLLMEEIARALQAFARRRAAMTYSKFAALRNQESAMIGMAG